MPSVPTTSIEEMLRFDSTLQLFESTATQTVEVAGVVVEEGQKVAALLGAANLTARWREPNSSSRTLLG